MTDNERAPQWLWTLLIIGALGLVIYGSWQWVDSTLYDKARSRWTEGDAGEGRPLLIDLTCGEGFYETPAVRQATLVVPPSNCWTATLLRPRDGNGNLSPKFFSDPDAEIRVRRFFEDGTSDSLDGITDSPLVWRKNHGPRIVARQYKNTGDKPVTIRLTLW